MTDSIFCALIVEDDRSWQLILSEILTDMGLAVDIANTLQEAVASLRATAHRLAVVDLALGDGNYHNQDGLEVLDAVRRQDPGCATIMLTGFATVELAVSVLTEHGAFSCLRKETFNRTEFRELVEQALASKPPVETSLTKPDHNPSNHTHIATVETPSPAFGIALIVEDDAGWRNILAELLADAGYATQLCNSFGEAMGCLRREKYALAVIDLALTHIPWQQEGLNRDNSLEGYQLLSTTQANHIPTIVVSGISTPEHIARVYQEQGVFAYLEKQTFDRQTFLKTVTEAREASDTYAILEELTNREQEVLTLLAQGLTNKEIANALFITTNTVKRHLKAIFTKLDVHTRAAATAKAIAIGLVHI